VSAEALSEARSAEPECERQRVVPVQPEASRTGPRPARTALEIQLKGARDACHDSYQLGLLHRGRAG